MKSNALPWILETESPGVRYLALRDIESLSPKSAKLRSARKEAYESGPIATVLSHMDKAGYWAEPGPGYNPKYRSTVWALILLAQLGASIDEDKRIARACTYLITHTLTPGGQFTASGSPSGTADCLQGNLCWALLELGCEPDLLGKAFDWMARSVTAEGIAPNTDRRAQVRFYAGKCGPTFACGANNQLSCAWGGVKVMLALARIPKPMRTPQVQRAIKQGLAFLLSTDPAKADYPSGYATKPSGNWWKFGFPVFYVTDLLQNIEALALHGMGRDPRLKNSIHLIQNKQDEGGRWLLEYDYAGKTWVDFGPKGKPNKWVTLRALRTLKALGV